ncbi:sialate O-acetylesterase [Belliella sp. R4-6]|uniref:Sialate O-acetylesterase n=1 Tax=Belliella alkalica TaxID=1730871 RepID=A0ABS9VD58_9BACT|nr:sialate O-acetylesterase [Belliella alkalica]MCH7414366.1 sialate O-acetylesterase [Belliella alkalica]
MKTLLLFNLTIFMIFFMSKQSFSQIQKINKKNDFSEIPMHIDLDSILNIPDTGIILTIGQSNAANYGQGSYDTKFISYELIGENIVVAKDPLSGADGVGVSVWTRLTDRLIEKQIFKNVIIIPIAIGSTEISCWSKGECNKKLTGVLSKIDKLKLKVNYIIWHQGESDNLANTSLKEYKNNLTLIKRQIDESIGNTPIIVSIASYHPAMIGLKEFGTDEVIRKAQTSFIMENNNTIKGPDTDLYDKIYYRHDGVHFSKLGLDVFADDLFEIIMKSEKRIRQNSSFK